MSEEPVPYYPTDKAELLAKRLRIEELEHGVVTTRSCAAVTRTEGIG